MQFQLFFILRKRLYAGTVPANKEYAAGTVPENKEYAPGTVPANKEYAAGTIPANKKYAAVTPLTRPKDKSLILNPRLNLHVDCSLSSPHLLI